MRIATLLIGGKNVEGLFTNVAMALLRVFAGAALALGHGWDKFPISDDFVRSIGEMGFPIPVVFAWLAAGSELVGGALVALGLLTRPAAVMAAVTMGVAAFVVHADDPFSAREMAMLYGSVFLFFSVAGGGRLSIDHLLSTGKPGSHLG